MEMYLKMVSCFLKIPKHLRNMKRRGNRRPRAALWELAPYFVGNRFRSIFPHKNPFIKPLPSIIFPSKFELEQRSTDFKGSLLNASGARPSRLLELSKSLSHQICSPRESLTEDDHLLPTSFANHQGPIMA